jgi:ATP-binding cassette, subfamily B, multidrug efflux pump
MAGAERIFRVLDRTPDFSDPPDALSPPTFRGHVEFRDLSFAYDGRPVLQGIRLQVPVGAVVALVGPTGSGKSSLVRLLPRLFDPPPGTLFIDGHDVREIPLDVLRAAIGFVPQEPFLFSTTIRENIAFGLTGAGAERVEWAGEVSQIARDVSSFPEGYDTPVGERGITLSGGQKQRTALARALAIDPRILILDDAFSSVDTETEERILRGLRQAAAGRTTFLVSHRISTVKAADLIVILRDGQIAETGTHEELVDRGGFYADLNRRQLIEREVETS